MLGGGYRIPLDFFQNGPFCSGLAHNTPYHSASHPSQTSRLAVSAARNGAFHRFFFNTSHTDTGALAELLQHLPH
ncbi:hypothetical protein Pyn_32938 [Prunus yedoensis var. nudiflora]|uniref:Uncharacterized protein n=1 Tax=Prunus yedoensis var. nudiflora TaxID=2094558 RepID=A0A314Y2U5_PRUYE|nr:hypothetical protein Pyn_01030 [Prunus yedoensis var. nudiflora]PQQ11909.1 hypothetical protein Pyn_32938 [Prunus yedoensis var. nudiflora]